MEKSCNLNLTYFVAEYYAQHGCVLWSGWHFTAHLPFFLYLCHSLFHSAPSTLKGVGGVNVSFRLVCLTINVLNSQNLCSCSLCVHSHTLERETSLLKAERGNCL